MGSKFLYKKEDKHAYLNNYDPLVKTQLGFYFMKYPQLQLTAILVGQFLIWCFSSDVGSNLLFQLYAVFIVRCIFLFALEKFLWVIGLDEINKELDNLIIKHKSYVFLFFIFVFSLILYSLNDFSLENEVSYFILGWFILVTVVQLIGHLYSEYEYKTKDFEKGDKPSILIGLRELKKIRDHHLQTAARLINFYSLFVNWAILLFLLAGVHNHIISPENSSLVSLFEKHNILFLQTKEFWWVLLPNFTIRYILFCFIECAANPAFSNSRLWSGLVKIKTASMFGVAIFGPTGMLIGDHYLTVNHNSTFETGDTAKVNNTFAPKFFVQWCQNRVGLIPYDSPEGQELSHILRSSGMNDRPEIALNATTGDLNPTETKINFEKNGFIFERDPINNNRFRLVPKPVSPVPPAPVSIFAPSTWFSPNK